MDIKNAKTGAINQTIKNLFTEVFLRIFLNPNLATPIPIMEAVFTCTREEGIPLLMEARSNKLAVINDMTMASIGPKREIPFPVCFNNIRLMRGIIEDDLVITDRSINTVIDTIREEGINKAIEFYLEEPSDKE
jgi:hypothetical protein